jgi:putative ABC transport system permease protein
MNSLKVDHAKIPSVHIEEGNDLSASDPYGAVLGKGLLEALGLKIGDTVTVLATRREGAIDSARYTVRGSFVSIMKEIDDRVMKVNLGTAQKLAGTPDRAHKLLIVLDDTERTEAAHASLQGLFRSEGRDLEARRWDELQPFYEQSRLMLTKIRRTIQVIVCVVFFFSISNTVNMGLLERVREFGTMMAIGNGRAAVFFVIMVEVLCLGLLGGLAGVLAGLGCAGLVSAIGIEMPPPPQGTYPYYAMITVRPSLIAGTFAIAALSTLLSGLGPAWRAVRLRVVEALGYV